MELFDSLVDRTCFTHYSAIFNCILQPSGKASDVVKGKFVGPTIQDKHVKFRDSLKQFSRNSTRSKGRRLFRRVFRDNFRQETVSDVISGEDVEYVGVHVLVKFGDSRSSYSR